MPEGKKLMEGLFTIEEIHDYKKKMVKDFSLPEFIQKERVCPECKETINLRGINGFGVKLNAQHIGNFFIEIICPNCSAGFEWHFQNICKNFDEFIAFILNKNNSTEPTPNYKIPSYENHLINNMMMERQKNEHDKEGNMS